LQSLSNNINCIVQTLKYCDRHEKSTKGLQKSNPPYLPNGDSVEEFFYIIGFRTLENGGVAHLQISKKNYTHVKMPIKHKNPKSHIYLATLTLLSKNNLTTSFKTLENGGVGHFKTFNMYHN
jgi:hypothetical protein